MNDHEVAVLYLSRTDVERVDLSMRDIIDSVEDVFREKGEDRVEMPPKPGIHPAPDAFIHAMPAYVPRLGAAGMKWVAGYPQNRGRGLPYISGLIVLNDPETGLPTMVCDCTWVTAMRTAAASAVAAKHLALPRSQVMAMIGCGVQGRSHLEALTLALPSLQRVQAYDIDRGVLETYATWGRERFGVEIVQAEDPESAVRGADVVITAGPILTSPSPIIRADWLKPGVFCCPIDFDSYFTGEAFRAADLLVTDDVQQLRYYRKVGYFKQTPEIDVDLGAIVTGAHAPRSDPSQRIIAVNLGIAIEDMAVAVRLLARARALGIGVSLPL
jgi:ornithine cyclodeaminase/alanine dehydrogenase-like protein (mu-crystallin family)